MLPDPSRAAAQDAAMLDARPAGELPPPTNRGVTVAFAGLHWFAGTVRSDPSIVLEALSEHLESSPVVRSRGGYGYASSAGVGAGSVYWSPDRDDVFVVLSGEACEHLGTSGLVALSTDLDLEPSSRLDIAWDVQGISPSDLRSEWSRGNVVTRAHRGSWEWHENGEGTTFYMGSRTSSRFVRAYDRRGPTRIELEVKEDRAVLLWRSLLAHVEEEWSSTALAELRAFVDFRDRSSGVRPDFCPLLDFWSAFVGEAERGGIVLPRRAPKLDSMRAWLRRQVAPVLALVLDADQSPEAMIRELYDNGRSRYRVRPERVALLDAEILRRELNAAD